MTEEYIDRLCRICMNESHSYSLIYEEVYPDNTMLFEVINDVCQLEVTIGDELPRHICSDCSFKLSEFRKFKIRSHEVQASLERLKENKPNLYLGIACESSLFGNQESIKVEVEPEYSYEYASRGMESFEDYTGIEPDDAVDVQNHDVIPSIPDPLDVTKLLSCTTDRDASVVMNQEHKIIRTYILMAVKGKKLFRRKLLARSIERRKIVDDPEEGTSYGVRRPIPCLNNDRVHFEGNQNPSLEVGTKEKFELDAFRENSTSKTFTDKSECHHNGGENPSNLCELDINEDNDNILKTFQIQGMPISRANKIGVDKNISECGDLTEEMIASKSVDLNESWKCTKIVNHDDDMHLMHDRKRYCCDICRRGFTGKFHLSEHITIHTGEKNFQCPICNKSFARKAGVRTHMIIHDKPHHVCTICGKEFKDKGSLIMHFRIHTNERNYICHICGKRFIQKPNLAVHLRTHTGERPFLCSVCGHGCKQSGDLKRHMNMHSGFKPFGCEICGMKFISKIECKNHTMRHGDEKPFSCDQCDKTFKVRNDLTVHLKVHGGLKSHKCSMCGKAFQRSYNLNLHLRTHTGERPYPCPNCGKCFSQSSSVNVHLKGSCKGKISEK